MKFFNPCNEMSRNVGLLRYQRGHKGRHETPGPENETHENYLSLNFLAQTCTDIDIY
jgi:hypothetical protein